jgi:hypothetical protein
MCVYKCLLMKRMKKNVINDEKHIAMNVEMFC